MTEPRRVWLTPQLIIGLAVAIAGVLFTLDNLGVLRARDFLRFWPVVLLVIGASQLAQARTPARVVSGLILMLLGTIFLGSRLNLVRWDVWDLWPLALVALGGYIVWQAFERERDVPVADAKTLVSCVAVLGGVQRRISAEEFRGGELTAFLGGCHVDLRDAKLADGQAVITVFAMMGGIELKVPETWHVIVEIVPFLGGVEDRTRQEPLASAPRLILRGFVTMGGVELKN